MEILTVDFETFFSQEYSLKKMTTEAYIRGDQFEALCLCAKNYETGAQEWVEGPRQIAAWVKATDWSQTVVVAQNAAFDVGLLSMRYGVSPRSIICTMSMARAVFGPGKSASLAALAAHYGLAPKTVPYNRFIGRHWADMDAALREELIDGCMHDVELTETIARKLLAVFPKSELPIVDLTVRMFTEPQFVGDEAALRALAQAEMDRKAALLDELDVSAGDLRSTARFVSLLEAEGEEVPEKPGKNGPIPAVAASDPYMQELVLREDRAGLLAQAKLDVGSAINETRAGRMAGAASRGPVPIYLNYFGAATSRWSGGDRCNYQNMPRGGELRRTLKAPPGHKIIVADFAQVEYRFACGLAGQLDKLQALKEGRDIYCEFGSRRLFGRTITKADKRERAFSKKPVLGGIYGIGGTKFLRTCEAEGFGDIPQEVREAAIPAFRADHQAIVSLWRKCDQALLALASGKDYDFQLEHISIPFRGGSVILPNGIACPFVLEWDVAEQRWMRTTRHGKSRYWGGSLTEFLCQSYARVFLSDVILKMWKNLGVRPALLVHDEYVAIVPEELAESALQWLLRWMSETPIWWKGGPPFDAEGAVMGAYGK